MSSKVGSVTDSSTMANSAFDTNSWARPSSQDIQFTDSTYTTTGLQGMTGAQGMPGPPGKVSDATTILLKLVYPFIGDVSKDYFHESAVLDWMDGHNHIVSYRPVVVLLAQIEGQLNRLTWE